MSIKTISTRSNTSYQENVIGWNWLIPVVLFSLVFSMAARAPLESDLWWHLRAGEETWETARPLLVDTFSFTRAGTAWINHSWLSQVGLHLLFANGGYLALSFAVAALATLSMVFAYAQMDAPTLLRAFVIVLAGVVAAPVWSTRPQLVSLVLFSLLAYLLYLYKWKQVDHLWLVIPIFILWSNMHGGYVLGLLLMTSLVAGEILNHLLDRHGWEILAWSRIGRVGVWLLVGGLVVAINPNGANMWIIPFKTVGVGAVQDMISEWGSPNFHEFAQQPMLYLLFLTFMASSLSNQRLDGTDLISVIGFAFLAFMAIRNYGPFALVAAPVLARHLHFLWIEQQPRWQLWVQHRFRRNTGRPPVRNAINVAIALTLILTALIKVYLVSRPQIVDQYNRKIFPVQAAAWLEANQSAGNLFNEYNWGGYLAWRLRAIPVFVDGRTDLYDDQLLTRYMLTQAGEADWRETLDRYKIGMVLIEHDSGLDRALKHTDGWSRRYTDELAVIYIRDGR